MKEEQGTWQRGRKRRPSRRQPLCTMSVQSLWECPKLVWPPTHAPLHRCVFTNQKTVDRGRVLLCFLPSFCFVTCFVCASKMKDCCCMRGSLLCVSAWLSASIFRKTNGAVELGDTQMDTTAWSVSVVRHILASTTHME